MMYVKGALLTAATFVIALGMFVLTSFYTAYPEAAPAPNWVIIAAGVALWVTSLFLLSKLPDRK
jgi:predicted membrane channel-forming protein YqfA (hemolysin III family)